MANKKQKDAAELLVEKNRDCDRLKVRVAELEEELRRYKQREEEIVMAITMAAQAKSKIIGDAESNAAAMERNAIKKAEATEAQSKQKAEQIIRDAENRAVSIINKAKSDAEALMKKTEENTKALMGAARAQADSVNMHCTTINAALTKSAAVIFRYIRDFREVYEEVTGDTLEKLLKCKELPEGLDAEEYDNPEDLFHAVMKLEGREMPEEAKAALGIEESVPFTAELFGDDDPAKNIESIINMGKPSAKAEANAPEAVIEIKTEESTATEKRDEKVDTEAAPKGEQSEAEMLTAMLKGFMDSIGDTAADSGKAAESAHKSGDEAAEVAESKSESDEKQEKEKKHKREKAEAKASTADTIKAEDEEDGAHAEESSEAAMTAKSESDSERENMAAMLDSVLGENTNKDNDARASRMSEIDAMLNELLSDMEPRKTDKKTVPETKLEAEDDLNSILDEIFGNAGLSEGIGEEVKKS